MSLSAIVLAYLFINRLLCCTTYDICSMILSVKCTIQCYCWILELLLMLC